LGVSDLLKEGTGTVGRKPLPDNNLSASATVDMLIAKETRLIDKQRKEDEWK
jgi:hypothetical protein